MFYIDRETELNTDLLMRLMAKFRNNIRPRLLTYDDYYNGNHNINKKRYADDTKPCSHIVTNYCKTIVDTYSGYIAGKPITYSSESDIDDVQIVINYNDDAQENLNYCKNALKYGVAYELQWIDNYSQIRYGLISPLDSFAVYSNDMEKSILYFVRWYRVDNYSENERYTVEVYDNHTIKMYSMVGNGGQLKLIDEREHYFNDVPISVFSLDDENNNIFGQVISLQDAYNDLQSGEVDSFNEFVDSYLILSNVDATKDDIQSMKENKVLLLPENSNASFLTKSVSDTQVENILSNLKRNIFKITSCIDMTDENFLAQSGTALSYKLVGFENVSSGIVANFTKALQRRIELICNILNLKSSEAIWRDIDIIFTRNLPTNNTDCIQLVNSLRGMVSDETLLSQLPFIRDVKKEVEKVREQREAEINLYSFGDDE